MIKFIICCRTVNLTSFFSIFLTALLRRILIMLPEQNKSLINLYIKSNATKTNKQISTERAYLIFNNAFTLFEMYL